MRTKNLALLTAALLLATLTGCGSSRTSDGSATSASPGTTAQAQREGSSSCKICHSAIVAEGFNGTVHDTAATGCEGCHGGGQFHKGVGPIPVAAPGPDQCIQCHSLATMTPVAHVDDPTTPTIIEGLVVKLDEADGCQSCHYSNHNPVLIANTEWSNSAHGGNIATGPVTSATADAWVHYNWDDTSTRGSCQRCHTATGISNFLNDPAGYAANGSGNDFSHLLDWSPTGGSGEQEVLFCWGCHSDTEAATPADPKLRNPGAIVETYTATTAGAPPTTVAYPNVGPSNACMGCHIGREIGRNITNDTDADGVRGFINSHYLTAGGTVFNTSGYEYAGQTYSNFGFHKNVGVGDAAANFNTGSNGPCVACHMSSGQKGHTFVFVTKNPDGVIESNESPLCTNCHAAMDADTLEATKESFSIALEELNVALQARGIFFFNANPYFFKAAGGTGGSFTDWNSVAETLGVGLSTDPTGTGWKNVMGAAFNYNLFEHDPGAYAHNSDYALKLIADSIDFLDDGLVNASAASAASGLIGQGMNIASGAGYSPIHDAPVVTAAAAPTTSEATCNVCHPAAPHYGGYPTGAVDEDGDLIRSPQWVNNQVGSCAECHGLSPALNQPVLTQYAESGHGDVTGVWTQEEAGGTCGRCHTTTGFISNLTGGAAFNYGANDPLQTLNCNGCHSSINGEGVAPLRAAPAFVASWSSNGVTASVTYPDALDSNLCIRCHSARRTGTNITNAATTTAHYLPAAAVVFGGTTGLVNVTVSNAANGGFPVGTLLTGGGYEFVGQVYDNLGPHKTVGLVAPDTRGPCVGCHMSGTAGHTWNAVTKNEVTGEVLAVNSDICAACHDGVGVPAVTPAFLNAEKATFDAALDLLDARLQARNIFFNETDGRFYTDAAFTTTVNNAHYAAQALVAPALPSTRDLQGAAYNLWLFRYHGADPAGYVHNSDYALKLIADSADMVNDGAINGL